MESWVRTTRQDTRASERRTVWVSSSNVRGTQNEKSVVGFTKLERCNPSGYRNVQLDVAIIETLIYC